MSLELLIAIKAIAKAEGRPLSSLSFKTGIPINRLERILRGERAGSSVELKALCSVLGGTPEAIVIAHRRILAALAMMRGEQ